jgi:hypothetical protein
LPSPVPFYRAPLGDCALSQRVTLAPPVALPGASNERRPRGRGAAVKLTELVGDCENGTCPTIYATYTGEPVVRVLFPVRKR